MPDCRYTVCIIIINKIICNIVSCYKIHQTIAGGFALGAVFSAICVFYIFDTDVYDKAWKFDVIFYTFNFTAILSAIVSGFIIPIYKMYCIYWISANIHWWILSVAYAMSLIGQFVIGIGLGAAIVGGLMYVREMSNDKYRNVMLTAFGGLSI